MTTETVMTMEALMSAVGTLVTNSITWIGEFVTVITSNPLLLAFVITSFVGLGVGLINRLIRL